MVEVKTYKGYDKDGKCVCTVTAKDANKDLNPEEVKAALDNLDKVMTDVSKTLIKSIEGLIPTAEEAVLVKGTGYKKKINDIIDDANTGVSSLNKNYDGLYENAVDYHDKKQRQYNREAKSDCLQHDVVRVQRV